MRLYYFAALVAGIALLALLCVGLFVCALIGRPDEARSIIAAMDRVGARA